MSVELTVLSLDTHGKILEHVDPASLATIGATSKYWKGAASNDELWKCFCEDTGIERRGSSKPSSRTYMSWRATWVTARCVECGSTYKFNVNLGGGSFGSAYQGKTVALCDKCSSLAAAVYVYRS